MRSLTITLALSISLSVLSIIVLLLRLFSRWHVCKRVGWDDCFITLAVGFSYLYTVPLIVAAYNGLGQRIEIVEASPDLSVATVLFTTWLAQFGHVLALGLVKISVLFFFKSLGCSWLRKCSIFLLYFISLQTIALLVANIFRCVPIKAFWTIDDREGYCVNKEPLHAATAQLNLITDVIVYILPVKLLWSLQLPQKRKLGLGVIICLGFFACVASAIRIYERPRDVDEDMTLNIAKVHYWGEVEINCAIIATSIPALKPLAKRYLSREGSNAGSNPGSGFGFRSGSGLREVARPQGRIIQPRQLLPSSNGAGVSSRTKLGSMRSLKRSIGGSSSDGSVVVLKSDAAVIEDLEKGRYFVNISGGGAERDVDSISDIGSRMRNYAIR